jgi:hypothetical protein
MVSNLDLLSIFWEEVCYLNFVTPIFVEGLVKQWSKYFCFNSEYDSLDETIERVMHKHSTDKVNLVGHSMGALESLAYTLNNPDNVDNCVTVAGPFGGTNMAIFGFVQFAFFVYTPSIFQLLPNSTYIQEMKHKIREKMPELEDKDVKINNIWSPVDEFLSSDETTLETILGRKSSSVNEHGVQRGHCSTFYCDTTLNILKNILQESKYPMVMLPGFTMSEKFYDIFMNDLSPEFKEKVYAISYDFAKILEV